MIQYINEAIKSLPAGVKLAVLSLAIAVSVLSGVVVKLYTDGENKNQQLLTQKDDQIAQLKSCTQESTIQSQKHDEKLQTIISDLAEIKVALAYYSIGRPLPQPAPQPN